MEVIITKHAKKRTKNRLGLSKKQADYMAKKALQYGVPHSMTKGNLNKYITSLYFKNKAANNIRILHQKVYIFSDDVLITILDLPRNLVAAAEKLEKSIKSGEARKLKDVCN